MAGPETSETARCCISPAPASLPATPGAAITASDDGTDAARSLLRSRCDLLRSALFLYHPGRPVVVDVRAAHALASSAVFAAAWSTGCSADAKDALKRDMYGHGVTGACRFAPLPHETYR